MGLFSVISEWSNSNGVARSIYRVYSPTEADAGQVLQNPHWRARIAVNNVLTHGQFRAATAGFMGYCDKPSRSDAALSQRHNYV